MRVHLSFTRALLVAIAGLLAASVLVLSRPDPFQGHPVAGQRFALVNARAYDPRSDRIVDEATVVIEDEVIQAVTTRGAVPEGAVILDLRGLTLLPGLIDSHLHLSGSTLRAQRGRLGWLSYLWHFLRSFPERRMALIEAGVTTAKSLGDPYPWIVGFADRIERHELAGPRIYTAGPMLTAPGGHPVALYRSLGRGDTSFIVQVAQQLPDEPSARTAVRQIASGVDFVTAVMESRGPPALPTLGPARLQTIVTEAHDRGLRSLVHVGSVADLETALEAGADGIEHLPGDEPITWETARRLAERGVVVDPTLGRAERLMPVSAERPRQVRQLHSNLLRLYRSGVTLVAGSEAPHAGPFGWSLHEELRGLVEAGVAPADAIAAATVLAARHLGADDRLGSLAPGMTADLIAVRGDPLTDIYALSDLYLVVADGQVLIDRLDRIEPRGAVLARTEVR